jgi:hypothetical protein
MDNIGIIVSPNMKNRSKYIIDKYLNHVINNYGDTLSNHHILELFDNYILPIEFIEKHIHKIHQNISLSFYRNNKQLKDDFYEKYKDILEWRYICLLDLSEEFFERNLEYILWGVFSSNRYISVDFFKKYLSKLDWESICRNESIPCSFFELYSHKLDWEVISENPNITVEFIKKYFNRMNFAPLCRRNLPEEFFEENINLITFSINPSDFNCPSVHSCVLLKLNPPPANKIVTNPRIPINSIAPENSIGPGDCTFILISIFYRLNYKHEILLFLFRHLQKIRRTYTIHLEK